MGWVGMDAQGAVVGVLSGLVVGGVLVVVHVVWGGVLCLYLSEWEGQGWRRRVRV